MADAASDTICFEQPLSERVRAFLRLEYLFARAEHELAGLDPWSSRAAMEALIDVLAVLGRSDLKKELLKELERHSAALEGWLRNPNVDQSRLNTVLENVRDVTGMLHATESTPGHELRDNDLLSAVRQRSAIPAGTCGFDLPAYHFWLKRPARERQLDIQAWLSTFDTVRSAIELTLSLLRESAVATSEVAPAGFFQKTLETSTPCQLIRVAVPADLPSYPEISAGKHRFTVRFMKPSHGPARPSQATADVAFRLLCCGL